MSRESRRHGSRLPLFSLLIFFGCQRQPLPERGNWIGTLNLPGGLPLRFRMSLDLSSPKPTGYFINGNEKTAIPEISRAGDNLIFTFSEYGAEMRGTWDGSRW